MDFGNPQLWLLCAAVLLLAGFVKGVIGLGLPTISIGLLGLVMPPLQAAALLVVPNLVTNVWQLATGEPLRAIVARLWPMLVGIIAGTLAGALAIPANSAQWALAALGVILAVYSVVGLFSVQVRVPVRSERWASPLVGFLTGIVTVATGVFVIPAVPYLQALGLRRDTLVQALGLSFLTSAAALAPAVARSGELSWPVAGASVAALAPALAGMFLGQAMRGRIGQTTFRRVFFGGLLLLGAYLAVGPSH